MTNRLYADLGVSRCWFSNDDTTQMSITSCVDKFSIRRLAPGQHSPEKWSLSEPPCDQRSLIPSCFLCELSALIITQHCLTCIWIHPHCSNSSTIFTVGARILVLQKFPQDLHFVLSSALVLINTHPHLRQQYSLYIVSGVQMWRKLTYKRKRMVL